MCLDVLVAADDQVVHEGEFSRGQYSDMIVVRLYPSTTPPLPIWQYVDEEAGRAEEESKGAGEETLYPYTYDSIGPPDAQAARGAWPYGRILCCCCTRYCFHFRILLPLLYGTG